MVWQCPAQTDLVAVVDRGGAWEGEQKQRTEPDAGPVVAGDGDEAGGVVTVEQVELGELDRPGIQVQQVIDLGRVGAAIDARPGSV